MIDDLLTAKLLMDNDDKQTSSPWGGGSAFLWVILIFLFFLAFSGNGLFGRGNGNGVEAAAFMAAANRNNDLSQMERDILETSNATQKEVCQNRFDAQLANQNLAAQMQQCCCDLKTTIIAENQITRDLIQANYIDGLRTALSDAKTQISNQAQTSYILGQIGQYYTHPSVNPNTCYNNCGCNNGCSGCNS